MATRLWILGTITALLATAGTSDAAAKVQTANFIVEAPTQEIAQEFAKLSEHFRKQKALEWLGREMPTWATPCPLRVSVTMSGAKGATSFIFPEGQVSQTMFIEGPLDRLRNSVLPHEITHTVLAHHFRRPVPRWADEGGSVYSEDELERTRHDRMCRDILNAGRGMPLRRLFNLKDYPSDVMVLYAEGYSVSKYLIEMSDRQTFLNFVGHGMQWGWDDAAKTHYQFKTIDEMEQAWLDHLRKNKGSAIAKNTVPNPDTKLVVRQSLPPVQPLLDPSPLSRGNNTSFGKETVSFGDQGKQQPAARLGDPMPMTPIVQGPTQASLSMNRPRNSPPPVVLFPPEPLPLR
ncbi:MAG: hypothetical protein K8T89_11840 [Planctomycetes bacterium]|nr:hypothetical protein [Planctomycetota bacterium]